MQGARVYVERTGLNPRKSGEKIAIINTPLGLNTKDLFWPEGLSGPGEIAPNRHLGGAVATLSRNFEKQRTYDS
jgi:hypothetical protein